MRARAVALGAAVAGLLAGCSGDSSGAAEATGSAAEGGLMASPVHDPRAMAVVPCAGVPMLAGEAAAPCVLMVAGGKRFLFGAPAGVAATISREDLGWLDAVFVYSLASEDLEGLDELRRATWLAGRTRPLRVFGPEGIEDVIAAINGTHVYGDAMQGAVSRMRGFNDLPMVAVAFHVVNRGALAVTVLDTGDVRIVAQPVGFDLVGYGVTYVGHDGEGRAMLMPCAAASEGLSGALVVWPGRDGRKASGQTCRGVDAGVRADVIWPRGSERTARDGAAGEPVFIKLR